MNLRHVCAMILVAATVVLTGCPKGNQQFNAGSKAESVKDYDSALDAYNKALQTQPNNIEYQLRAARARFEAGQWHVDQGRRLRQQGNLDLAVAEFRKASMIDPSSVVASQELQATLELMNAKQGTTENSAPAAADSGEPKLMAGPPQVQPLSRAPISMKATNDAKAVFDAIGKLAGLTVIFDVDFTSRRISVELNNVTLEQALNIAALQSKAFWRPITSNIIFVAPDQPQKRKDYEEEIVKTFYLQNITLPQELTEIITSIRQLLDLRRVQQINAQNAIVIRDTPDRVMLAGKIIDDIDKAKPEVVIQVAVMQARTDRLKNIGINPGTSVSATFAPTTSTTTTPTTTGTTTPTTTGVTLGSLIGDPHVFSNGYSVTLPSASASFLMTDSSTFIIDDPEIRVVDGQTAKLRIGDRVPVATGSFTAGVGATTTAVNALVNTQFQYLDVGVNVDVTPRIHPDHEISMKVNVVVSSVTGTSTIGGIAQPIISQRSIEHDIRLKDGEVNVLGGLIERTDTKAVNGWPGLAALPFFKYFFANDTTEHTDNEVLIVLIPHIVRLPTITAANLRSIASGTDTNAEVRMEDEVMAPPVPKAQSIPASAPPQAAAPAPAAAPTPSAGAASQNSALRFEPASVSLKPGETTTVGIVVQNVQDLYSIPLLLQFNPAVISVEDVRQGGFLSGGTQEIAIVERVDKERGQAIISASRMPNTPGVSGSGTLVGIVIKGVAPGNSQLSIVQVNAKDSQQRPIQMVTGESTVRVQ